MASTTKQPTITDWRTFNPKRDLVFHEPKQNSHRGFGIKLQVQHGDGQVIDMYHQTPVLRMPFAIGEMEGDYGKKYEARSRSRATSTTRTRRSSSFPGDEEMENYHRFLHNWDEFNLDLAASKTKEWFKKHYSRRSGALQVPAQGVGGEVQPALPHQSALPLRQLQLRVLRQQGQYHQLRHDHTWYQSHRPYKTTSAWFAGGASVCPTRWSSSW